MDPSFRRALRGYNAFLLGAVPAALPLWLPWMLAAAKRRRNFLDRAGWKVDAIAPTKGRPVLWFHAVSVGETLAAAPLVRAARREWPGASLHLSTVTLTGRDTARKALGDVLDGHFFFPFDVPAVVSSFLRHLRPDAVVVLETEIWPNFLAALAREGVPALLVNGRMSDRSLRRYRRFRALFGGALATLRSVAAQSAGDAERYRALLAGSAAAPPVTVTGNMKFDTAVPDLGAHPLAAWLARCAGAGTRWIVAGSTHAGEEEALLGALRSARDADPKVRLVLAPRHPERFDEVERLALRGGFRTLRRSGADLSSPPPPCGAPEVLLLDTVGELAAAYGAASLAFVGGSLSVPGGHNVIEPALFGVPVVTGTRMENFREVERLFRAEDALVQVRDGADLARVLAGWARDPATLVAAGERGRGLLDRYRGATGRNLSLLRDALGEGFSP